MKAIVVGAGIAGLACAVALQRIGLEVQVLEKAPQLRLEGAGISLWSNAVRALQELRVDEQVLAVASPLLRAETLNHQGRLITRSSLSDLSCGAPSICVSRGALLSALAEQLGDGVVRFDCAVQGYEQVADEVTVKVEEGEPLTCDLLIGADGIHSSVRVQILGDDAPRSANTACWRGAVEWASPYLADGTTQLYLGHSAQLGLVPCGPGAVYWFAARRGTSPQGGSPKDALLEFFQDWAPQVVEVLRATPDEAILHNEIIDRPPALRWGTGRVALVGDAIHSTTPNLGQGGCQALESAVMLAHCLRVNDDPSEALASYGERRRPRTAWITRQSELAGKMLQLGPLLGGLRDRYLASGLGQWGATAMLERLIEARVPPLP